MRFLSVILYVTFFFNADSYAQSTVAPQISPTPENLTSLPSDPNSRAERKIKQISIFKHFRFDDGEELVPAPTPTPQFDFKAIGKRLEEETIAQAKEVPDLNEMVFSKIKAPELFKCSENMTGEVPLGMKMPEGLEGEKSASFDMLFMKGDEIPDDYQFIFGVTTLVVPYVTESPNVGWELISDLGVPCLPYRIRFQGSKFYADAGLNALKNYSKSPKGEFHPFIKARYGLK